MHKMLRILLLSFILFSLTSCFELIEDTTLKSDGSGTYKLTVNLSASTPKINSIMVMDSIQGKKVPSKKELQAELNQYTHLLKENDGISNITSSLDTDSWVLKLSLDFKSLTHLKDAIIQVSEKISKEPANDDVKAIVLVHSNNLYKRKIGALMPNQWKEKIKSEEAYQKLHEGKCVFIQRFENEISTASSDLLKISKNRKAAMLQLTPKQIIDQPSLIDYCITTKK